MSSAAATDMRRAFAIIAALFALSAPARALAEPTPIERRQAEALFQDALTLMDSNKFSDACPKLEESQRLDPAGGTLLQLAMCHEGMNRTATAVAELEEALAQAKREGKSARATAAQEHLDRLKPRLSFVVITVAADAPGIEVRVVTKYGSSLVAKEFWGKDFAVDPGDATIRATAPGRRPFEATVTIGAERDKKPVDVPALEIDKTAPPPPPPTGEAKPLPPPYDGTRRTAAFVVGGFGVVALGVGAYFGIAAIGKNNDSNNTCPPPKPCGDATAVAQSKDAVRYGTISDVGIGVGVVALGVGAYLFLTAPKRPANARITPTIGPTHAGIAWSGAW